MAAKELRIVQDSKFTGSFTRQQIDRAIRQVERERGGEAGARKDRGDGARRPLKDDSQGKR